MPLTMNERTGIRSGYFCRMRSASFLRFSGYTDREDGVQVRSNIMRTGRDATNRRGARP